MGNYFFIGTDVPAILDTQTVLDWRFFRDPACASWSAPGGHWRWLATPAMRDELAHVLARGIPGRWTTPAREVLGFFDAYATVLTPPALDAALARRLRCRDPDDQKFIDLAVATGRCDLVSRDRAVLALARHAAAHGVRVLPPGRWVPPPG